MENLTIVGMKELGSKISRMERTMEEIAKSLETIAKILNRKTLTSNYARREITVGDDDDEE